MALYLSIVLLAAFAALPSDSGIHGPTLVALIWGTTFGLAFAHWFAFRLTARLFGGGSANKTDVRIGVAQLTAAAIVAGLCTVPVVIFDDGYELRAVMFVPAIIVGAAGFLIYKSAGHSTIRSLALGGVVLLAGLAIAALKNFLVGY